MKWRGYAEQAADLALSSGDHPTAVTFLYELLNEPELPGGDIARIAKKMPVLAFNAVVGGPATSFRAQQTEADSHENRYRGA